MLITQSLSSANCLIKFGNKEVGAIQNLKINSRNNVNRMTNVFGTYNQKFIRGTLEYDVVAEKAFIDMSSFYGGLNDFLSARNDLSEAANDYADLQGKDLTLEDAGKVTNLAKVASSFIKTAANAGTNVVTGGMQAIRDNINKLVDPDQAKKESDAQAAKQRSPDDILGNRVFDIEISSPVQTGFLIGSTNNSLWTLKDCKIVGRDIKIDINNIIIIEGMVIFAKKFFEEYQNTVNYSGTGEQ